MITELIDELSALVSRGSDAGSILIRLAAVRLEAQGLLGSNEELRGRCAALEKSLHQEIVRRNQTAAMLRTHLPSESVATQSEARRPAVVKSRLKKPVARGSDKRRRGR